MLGNYYNVPVISWAAKDRALSDRFRFPTFARTVPPTNTCVGSFVVVTAWNALAGCRLPL